MCDAKSKLNKMISRREFFLSFFSQNGLHIAHVQCFPTVVLERMLENSLSCKVIKPVNPKGNQL